MQTFSRLGVREGGGGGREEGRAGCTITDLPGGEGMSKHTICNCDLHKHMEPRSENRSPSHDFVPLSMHL